MRVLALPTLPLMIACAAGAGPEAQPSDLPSPGGKADAVGPGNFRCVSGELADSGGLAVRAVLETTEEGVKMTGATEAIFEHEGEPPEPVDLFDEAVTGTIDAEILSLAGDTTTLELTATLPGLFEGSATFGELETDVVCFADEVAMPAFYSDGNCRAISGEPTRNPLPMAYIREAQFGECADLSFVELNGGDLDNPILRDWNLRGADLTGASLTSATLTGVDLSGAIATELLFSDVQIDGVIDRFTLDPPCDPEDLNISCQL